MLLRYLSVWELVSTSLQFHSTLGFSYTAGKSQVDTEPVYYTFAPAIRQEIAKRDGSVERTQTESDTVKVCSRAPFHRKI